MKYLCIILPLFLCSCVASDTKEHLSPSDLAITPDAKTALIANQTGRSLFRVSLPEGEVERRLALKKQPTSVSLSKDGNTAYVTVGIADGELLVLNSGKLKIQNRIKLGHTPMAPCVSPDGETIYVCNRMNHTVVAIDTKSMQVSATIPVLREPVALDITPDGKLLFVANHLPAGRADVDHVSCEVSVIDASSNKLIKNISLVNGAESLRGITISPDGNYVYATHLVARYLVPTTQIERGWINTSAVSILRVSDQALLCTVLLDDVDMGFANPWGVAVNKDSSLMAVTAAGTHELSLIDLKALTAKIGDLDEKGLETHNDLSFISEFRKRVQLKGIGPREVAISGNNIYTTEYFSDSLGRIALNTAEIEGVTSIPLGPKVPISQERRGEMLFNDATMCFQKWQSCASCHPDVRSDALNWDLLNDGIGNPKNAKSLILSHKTPPVMALGVRAKAEVAVRAGIKYIQFVVRPEEEAEAIDAYLRSLKPDPSPYLQDGKLSKAAKRGRKIFKETGCIDCHPAPLYTDLNKYNVGTGTGQDQGKPFDTPTLREVWRTAPYMHDGRSETIGDVIKIHNPNSEPGEKGKLSEEQIKDLAEYVNSL